MNVIIKTIVTATAATSITITICRRWGQWWRMVVLIISTTTIIAIIIINLESILGFRFGLILKLGNIIDTTTIKYQMYAGKCLIVVARVRIGVDPLYLQLVPIMYYSYL